METAESLVREATSAVKSTSHWYENNMDILKATDYGRLMFLWEAVYHNGTIMRQFDEVTFYRALMDDTYNPGIEKIISTRSIDPYQVRLFSLYSTAYIRKHCPWFHREYRVHIRTGEKFVFQWETDEQRPSNLTIRRTVIGIERPEGRVYFAISPSGALSISTSLDISFEGEGLR